ncbi:hypothetical protein PAESOLCIP111_06344 [Paenibacillus solanacearum]|uniref:DUF4179 domain-containing protein n=1 Tax=Paenibacillus solanacearum TaxID=2048548 RepID=A0A916KAC2_9BACL|nr:hypothetical protein [Paenibacillus solanacearum]CAG7651579.1 hypothetical protein PAESOLCIP111_06344 [Paenibacillus solanacearum]
MRDAGEKQLYRLIDRLEQEEGLALADKVSADDHPEEALAPERLEQVKRRTWEKLGLPAQAVAEGGVEPTEARPPERQKPQTGETHRLEKPKTEESGWETAGMKQAESRKLPTVEKHGLAVTEVAESETKTTEAQPTGMKEHAPEAEQKPTRKRLPPWRKKALIAASALILVVAAVIGSSADVRADIKKALRFIPGFGYVQEEDRAQPMFVLPKPAVKQVEDGELRIDAILVEASRTLVQVSGKGRAEAPNELAFVTADGKTYPFKRAMLATSGEWQGMYYYEGTIPVTAETDIILKLGRTNIGPLRLTEPKTGDELQDLGMAATTNGIKVAAVVTPLTGDKMKVNLLSQLPQGMKLESYGLQPINSAIRTVLLDETGEAVTIPEDSGFVKKAEFDFEDGSGGKSRYTLSIPYLRVVHTEAPFQTVTLPVPAAGESQDLNISVTVAGFPVQLYRIERADAKNVRIFADVHFDADAPATLQDFRVDMIDPHRQSYSWKVTDDTRAMDRMQLEILPEMKQLTFKIGEPWILFKGPWNIELGQMPAADR